MTQPPTYGPHNPHPLSQMRTELVWEGKYDEYGQRREVDIAGCAMPMQKIESIDEPRRAVAATGQLELFEQQNPKQDDFRNRLFACVAKPFWGDNKLVMASLLQEFKGKVDLIYIDPPFDVGADFSMSVAIGDEQEAIEKEQSTLEMVAYRDIWGKGTDSFLQMIHERLVLARELLNDNGLIFVHIGWFVSHQVKALLDDVFGNTQFLNQIVWKRQTAHSDIGQGSQHLGRIHDVIFLYSKSESFTWNMQYQPYSEEYINSFYKHIEPETGRRYRLSDTTGPGGAAKGNPRYEFLGVTRYWRFKQERMEDLYKQGRIIQTKPGTVPQQKRYLDEGRGAGGEGKTVDIKLTQFLPSLAEVPTKELEAIRERAIASGFDFIDFWAIDFNWQPGKPFTHDWQDYRTRKDRSLKTISDAGYTYPTPGKYTACVKVVDTFGCDTSIAVEVEV